jgi:circularin A/uberolysin family circular bacteriocin
MNLFHVAGKFHVGTGVATAVVGTVMNAGSIITVIGAVSVALSGGLDAILEMGWTAFVAEIKHLASKYGKKRAISW